MPRFYFNIHDGKTEVDTEGSELDGIVHARREAIRLAADALYDESDRGIIPSDWHLEVLNEHRETVLVLEFTLKEQAGTG